MRLHLRRLAILLILVLVPATAKAHDHVWDFSLGGAMASGSKLYGFNFSLGVTNPVPADRNLSWLFDAAYVRDTDNGVLTTQQSYLVGARYALPYISRDRVAISLLGLTGVANKQTGGTGKNRWALTAGAQFEWVVDDARGLGARVQVEHSFLPDDSVKGFWKYTASFVKRFD